MALFGNTNSIEAAETPTKRKRLDEDLPIREATPREMARLHPTQAPAAKKEPDVQAVNVKAPAERDPIAEKHGLYTADAKLTKTRTYFNDYQQKTEAFRATAKQISSRLSDRQTVTAMLDLAQERGWSTVKLRGTDEFKREAWVQAQERGLETAGYKPKETDRQEADRRVQALEPVKQASARPAEAAPAVAPTQATTPKDAADRLGATEEQRAMLRDLAPNEQAAILKNVGLTIRGEERYLRDDEVKGIIQHHRAQAAKEAPAQALKPAANEAVKPAAVASATPKDVWNTVETAGKAVRAAESAPTQRPSQKVAA